MTTTNPAPRDGRASLAATAAHSDSDSPLAPDLCDLHMHTTCSDGTDSPAELVAKAARRGLHTISITDHDTIEALAPALAAAREIPNAPRIIPGIELSTDHGPTGIHMLGYQVPVDSPDFDRELHEILTLRDARNREMVDKLNDELNLDITLEEVAGHSSGNVVARPHFARVLMERGVVTTMQEAFERFIGDGRPCFVERERFESADAIRWLHSHGAYAVIAHPGLIRIKNPALTFEDLVAELAAAGIDGIEAHYSLHTPTQTAQYVGLAQRYGLIATAGSDYHGRNKTDIALGSGLADRPVAFPRALVEPLLRPCA
jgi:predicted metal-dependent phosphoesterase TrpH